MLQPGRINFYRNEDFSCIILKDYRIVKTEGTEDGGLKREAELFLDSDGHRNILKDKVTVSASWEKLNIICKTHKRLDRFI